jgi:hypothetical protein
MRVHQTYDLSDLDSGLFSHVCDTVRFSKKNVASVRTSGDARTLSVEARDQRVLRYIDGLIRDARAATGSSDGRSSTATRCPRRTAATWTRRS